MKTWNSYKCEKCRDATWIIRNGMAKRCSCFEINRSMTYFKNSGIDVAQSNFNFSSYEILNEHCKKMKSLAMAYYKNYEEIKNTRQNSLAFLGKPGVGKTHLTIALGINLINKKNIPVMYMSYRECISNIKRNIMDEEFISREMDKYKNAEILLIDDLLKGKVTESDVNILFEIINHRYMKQKPMVISSEYTVDRLMNFDEAIGSRIYEMSKGYIHEVKSGENYRTQ